MMKQSSQAPLFWNQQKMKNVQKKILIFFILLLKSQIVGTP